MKPNVLLFYISISIVTLIAGSLHAQICETSENSCSFYSCLEQTSLCGPGGYPLQFGYKQCTKYLDAEPRSLPEVQIWYRKVRFCLQESLNGLVSGPANAVRCEEIKQVGFASHTNCYLAAGFCELSKTAKIQILETIGKTLLQPSSFETAVQIQKACRRKIPFNDEFEIQNSEFNRTEF